MNRPSIRSLLWVLLAPAILLALAIVLARLNLPQRPAPAATNWAELGALAFTNHDYPRAISMLSLAAAEQGLQPIGWLMLGDAYRAIDDPANALLAWQNAGNTSEIISRRYETHREIRDYEAAIADLKEILRLHPEDAAWQYQLGLLLAATRPDQAIPYLEHAASTQPGSLRKPALALKRRIQAALPAGEPAYIQLEAGRGLIDLYEWELAAEAFRGATLLRPDYAEAWAFLGEALQHIDIPAEESFSPAGLTEIKRALQLDPKSISANLFLALYWRRQGELSKAQEILEKLASAQEQNPAVQIELGNTLADKGNFKDALSHFVRATELAPDETQSWLALAGFSVRIQYQVRQVGLPAARQLLLLTPTDPEALDLMGEALLLLDDPINAERFIRRAIDADAAYSPAHLHLAQVYLGQGATAAARREVERVCELAPSSCEFARRLLETNSP